MVEPSFKLENLEERGVRFFIASFRAYEAQAIAVKQTPVHPSVLLSQHQINALSAWYKAKNPQGRATFNSLTSEECLTFLSSLYGDVSIQEARRRLAAVKQPTGVFSVGKVMDWVGGVMDIVASCEVLRKNERDNVRGVLRSLVFSSFADNVLAENPTTFDEMVVVVLTQAELFVASAQVVSARLPVHEKSSKLNQQSKPAAAAHKGGSGVVTLHRPLTTAYAASGAGAGAAAAGGASAGAGRTPVGSGSPITGCAYCKARDHTVDTCEALRTRDARRAAAAAAAADQGQVLPPGAVRQRRPTDRFQPGAPPTQNAIRSTSSPDASRRGDVTIIGPGGSVFLSNVLLDTGADRSTISDRHLQALQDVGLIIFDNHQTFKTFTGKTIHLNKSVRVDFDLVTHDGRVCKLHDIFTVSTLVEDVILSYATLQAAGLRFTFSPSASRIKVVYPQADSQSISFLRDPSYPSQPVDPVVVIRDLDDSDTLDWPGLPLISAIAVDSPQDLSIAIDSSVSPSFRARILEVLEECREVFDPNLPPEGADVEPVKLHFKPDVIPVPVNCKQSRVPKHQANDIRARLHTMLEQHILRRAKSHWSSPTLFIPKKDATARWVHSFKKLNEMLLGCTAPMEDIRELIECLTGARYFGKLDCTHGFFQVRLDPESQDLTAFHLFNEQFAYLKVPQGLSVSPQEFQKRIRETLSDLLGKCVINYCDDLLVFGRTKEEFINNLRLVCQRLSRFRWRLQIRKCRLGVPEIEWCGLFLSGDGYSMAPSRIDSIVAMPRPTNVREMRRLLGMASFLRNHVPNFAGIVVPLTKLTSEKHPFVWTAEQETAFLDLRTALANAVALHYDDSDEMPVLQTDASDTHMAAVLLQDASAVKKPMGYFSAQFSGAERNWTTMEKEAFAIVRAVRHFHYLLAGRRFSLQTDNHNLLFIHNSPVPKIARWSAFLRGYDMTISHIKGVDNVVADHLTRPPIVAAVSVQPSGASSSEDKPSHEQLIARYHSFLEGHFGAAYVLERLRHDGHSWPGMRRDVETFVRSCVTCQKLASRATLMPKSLSTTMTSTPLKVWEVDFVGPLPVDADGNSYIAVAVDCCTRMLWARASPGPTALDAARVLLDVFSLFGPIDTVRSDQGTHFRADVVRQFLHLMGVSQSFSVPYHPASMGIVERHNQEVLRHLRAITFDKNVVHHWSICLPLAIRLCNSSPSRITGVSPAQMVFGGFVDMHRPLFDPSLPLATNLGSPHDYVLKLRELQQHILDASMRHQQSEVERILRFSPPNPTVLAPGTLVLVKAAGRPASKLHPRWLGPFAVVERLSSNAYRLQRCGSSEQIERHLDFIKTYDASQCAEPADVALRDKVEDYISEIFRDLDPG